MGSRQPTLGRRKLLKSLAGAALWDLLRPASTAVSADTILWRGARDMPGVALTFDDCFSLALLQELEKALDQHPHVRVTFFPVGIALLNTSRNDKDLWQRLARKGHEIGYHTHEHRRPSDMTLEQFEEDYGKWLSAYEQAAGEQANLRFARPPYGDRSRSFLDLCEGHDLVPTMWSKDWSRTPEPAPRMTTSMGGDIALMHVRGVDIQLAKEVLKVLPSLPLRGVGLSELYYGSKKQLVVDALRTGAWWQANALLASPGIPLRVAIAARPAAPERHAAPAGPGPLPHLVPVWVKLTPLTPEEGGWRTGVTVTVANRGGGASVAFTLEARISKQEAPDEPVAELRWRGGAQPPGGERAYGEQDAKGDGGSVVLPPGGYLIEVTAGIGEVPAADGGADAPRLGPLPFEIRPLPRRPN